MADSSIEWTEATWNPVTGCSKVSAGCKHCYAEVMARRLKAMGVEKYDNGFTVTMHPDVLDYPYTLKKGKIIFVNSMSDLFHKDVTDNFIKKVFKVMNDNPQHVFQVLTKRPERFESINNKVKWTENIWLGVSVEDKLATKRIKPLVNSGAKVKFLSMEPLIGRVQRIPYLHKINWVIVGGESGHGARPMDEDWVLEIKCQCEEYDVPFFFKQWGGVNKKRNGRILLNQTWDSLPDQYYNYEMNKELVAH